jgi:kinesin family protein 5
MIVTCSPHSSSIEETISTLKFAVRAKNVKNYYKVNYKSSENSMKNVVSKLS